MNAYPSAEALAMAVLEERFDPRFGEDRRRGEDVPVSPRHRMIALCAWLWEQQRKREQESE